MLAGCAKPGASPGRSVIDSNVQFATVAPDAADYVSARIAAAALVAGDDEESRYEVERALASLEAIERVLDLADEPRTGLVPAARDLRNAALYDHRGYRISAEELLSDDGLDPALRESLEASIANVRAYQEHILPKPVEPVMAMRFPDSDSLITGSCLPAFSTNW